MMFPDPNWLERAVDDAHISTADRALLTSRSRDAPIASRALDLSAFAFPRSTSFSTSTTSWLVDQNQDQPDDEEDEKQDALPLACVALISLRDLQLFHRIVHLPCCLLHIVLNAVEDRSLLHDQAGQVPEQVGEFCDAVRNLRDLGRPEGQLLVQSMPT